MAARTVYVDGLEVTYNVTEVNGRPAVTEMRLRGADIKSDQLRAIKPARLLAVAANTAPTELCVERRSGEPADDFYRRYADAYRTAAVTSNRPNADIAKANGVAPATAAMWAREARRRGHLEPARKRRG